MIAPNGDKIDTQMVAIPEAVRLIPGRKSKARYELLFEAELPPLGFKSYYVKQNSEMIKVCPLFC